MACLHDDAHNEEESDVHPSFPVEGVDRTLPPGEYEVITDEELIEGLSFPVYRRASMIFVPAQHRASSLEMVTVDPLDLQAAQDHDADMPGKRAPRSG